MSVAKLETEVETLRRSSRAAREKSKVKGRKTRRASDGTAGSVRRRAVWQEQSTQDKEEGKSGPQLPAFDEARCGGFICRAETARDRYSMRKVS